MFFNPSGPPCWDTLPGFVGLREKILPGERLVETGLEVVVDDQEAVVGGSDRVAGARGLRGGVVLASVVWDMATRHVARVFPGPVVFFPDGQLLVAEPVGALSSMTVWDGPLGARLREVRLPWPEAVGGLSVSPDGQYIAFGLAERTIRFSGLDAGHEVAKLNLKAVLGVDPEVEFRIAEVSFLPDGELLLTTAWTPLVGRHRVHLWRGAGILEE